MYSTCIDAHVSLHPGAEAKASGQACATIPDDGGLGRGRRKCVWRCGTRLFAGLRALRSKCGGGECQPAAVERCFEARTPFSPCSGKIASRQRRLSWGREEKHWLRKAGGGTSCVAQMRRAWSLLRLNWGRGNHGIIPRGFFLFRPCRREKTPSSTTTRVTIPKWLALSGSPFFDEHVSYQGYELIRTWLVRGR